MPAIQCCDQAVQVDLQLGQPLHDGLQYGQSLHDGLQPGQLLHDGLQHGQPLQDSLRSGQLLHGGLQPSQLLHDDLKAGQPLHDDLQSSQLDLADSISLDNEAELPTEQLNPGTDQHAGTDHQPIHHLSGQLVHTPGQHIPDHNCQPGHNNSNHAEDAVSENPGDSVASKAGEDCDMEIPEELPVEAMEEDTESSSRGSANVEDSLWRTGSSSGSAGVEDSLWRTGSSSGSVGLEDTVWRTGRRGGVGVEDALQRTGSGWDVSATLRTDR